MTSPEKNDIVQANHQESTMFETINLDSCNVRRDLSTGDALSAAGITPPPRNADIRFGGHRWRLPAGIRDYPTSSQAYESPHEIREDLRDDAVVECWDHAVRIAPHPPGHTQWPYRHGQAHLPYCHGWKQTHQPERTNCRAVLVIPTSDCEWDELREFMLAHNLQPATFYEHVAAAGVLPERMTNTVVVPFTGHTSPGSRACVGVCTILNGVMYWQEGPAGLRTYPRTAFTAVSAAA